MKRKVVIGISGGILSVFLLALVFTLVRPTDEAILSIQTVQPTARVNVPVVKPMDEIKQEEAGQRLPEQEQGKIELDVTLGDRDEIAVDLNKSEEPQSTPYIKDSQQIEITQRPRPANPSAPSAVEVKEEPKPTEELKSDDKWENWTYPPQSGPNPADAVDGTEVIIDNVDDEPQWGNGDKF